MSATLKTTPIGNQPRAANTNVVGFGQGANATKVTIDEDGGVTISAPAVHRSKDAKRIEGFNENLAETRELDLAGLAGEVLEGVDYDQKSRSAFTESFTSGIELLGLAIKDDKNEKTSQVGHPLLLEAVVRAQSAAGAELMPSEGPCKVETISGDSAEMDDLADAFQRDMNAYLTSGAPEYYPDTDRGLFSLFYSGNMFKKVYEHPLRRRPVSETIEIEDLIVSQDATDLETALRVSHSSEMSTVSVKRMQKFADWRDVDLGEAMPDFDGIKAAQMNVAGLTNRLARRKDNPHQIIEVTADLDLAEYGLHDPKVPDLPLSYIVTVDKQSQQILAVRRGWKDGDEQFKRRQRFVHYGMVPGFNFLCLGFVHLLGNQTRTLRGIWRMLVTAGMYANSPAGLKVKGLRTGSNDIRPGPGEWADVDIAGMDDIRKALMAMPYNDVSANFMQLASSIGTDAMRMAGMANMEVGEGRTNVPVGTMMSMIEVATQTMSAVHKRMHRAQARELQLIKDCFAENPEALSKLVPNPAFAWTKQEEFANFNLIPASDPNVPSQIHRIQLATALVTVAGQNPDLYDRVAVHKRAWKTIGVNDADNFVLAQPAPPPPAGGGAAPPDPLIGQARMMEAQGKIAKVKQDGIDMQRKAAEAEVESQHRTQELQMEATNKQMEMAARQQISRDQSAIEAVRLQIEQARLAAQHARESQGSHMDAATQRHVAHVKAAVDLHKTETQALSGFHVTQTDAETQRHLAERSHATEKMKGDNARSIAKLRPKPAPRAPGAKPK